MRREYFDYIQDISDSIEDIETFTRGLDFYSFEKDRKTRNAVLRSLEVIGEAVKNIPEEIRKTYPDIPWKGLAGMRDKLIHEYFGVDTKSVWKAVHEEIPPLKTLFQKIFDNLKE